MIEAADELLIVIHTFLPLDLCGVSTCVNCYWTIYCLLNSKHTNCVGMLYTLFTFMTQAFFKELHIKVTLTNDVMRNNKWEKYLLISTMVTCVILEVVIKHKPGW